MIEKVKLLIVFIAGILLVSMFTTNSINNIEFLNSNVEKNKASLYSNIKEYNDIVKQMLNTDKEEYNNIDYSIASDIDSKSSRLDECIEEGDIEKINNSFDSLISSSKSLLTVDYNSSNELFYFVIMETKLSSLETKIFIEQKNYNYAVNQYNREVTSFPTAIISFLYGYDTINYFEGH